MDTQKRTFFPFARPASTRISNPSGTVSSSPGALPNATVTACLGQTPKQETSIIPTRPRFPTSFSAPLNALRNGSSRPSPNPPLNFLLHFLQIRITSSHPVGVGRIETGGGVFLLMKVPTFKASQGVAPAICYAAPG